MQHRAVGEEGAGGRLNTPARRGGRQKSSKANIAVQPLAAKCRKDLPMAQISRPFQRVVLVVALLAGVWMFALHGRSTTVTEPAAQPAASAPAPGTAASSSSTPSGAASGKTPAGAAAGSYHGSAPGVAGLTSAIAKANGAVATSQQSARELSERSDQASSPAVPAASSAPATPATPATPAHASTPAVPVATSAPLTASAVRAPAPSHAGTHAAGKTIAAPPNQVRVERALGEGKVAVILFWNAKGTDDVAVRRELRLLGGVRHVPFAAFEAPAGAVASFGSITSGVQVYGTPTLVIIGKSGHAKVLSGLTDIFAINQAIQEAHGA